MARLERASRLRCPRRIMISMVSLRNRLAAAPTPSSPVRCRYSQAIWNESSSSWESETLMGGKRIRAARVPCHQSSSVGFWSSTATVGAEGHVAENVDLRSRQLSGTTLRRVGRIPNKRLARGSRRMGLLWYLASVIAAQRHGQSQNEGQKRAIDPYRPFAFDR
jgi:hypothetical protein